MTCTRHLLYRVTETVADQVQLQQDLKHLEQWATTWGMVFNPPKCYIMSVSKGKTQKSHFYELCGVLLKSVDHEKYLGVILSQDMTWGSTYKLHHIQSK